MSCPEHPQWYHDREDCPYHTMQPAPADARPAAPRRVFHEASEGGPFGFEEQIRTLSTQVDEAVSQRVAALTEERDRLKVDLELITADRDAVADECECDRLKQNSYPHMCQNDHQQIGHSDSEHEMCPLCRALARVQALEQVLQQINSDARARWGNRDTRLADIADRADRAIAPPATDRRPTEEPR